MATTPDRAELVGLLRAMTLIRRFEELALRLREENRIAGVVHPYIGEEAIAIGVAAALEPRDRVVSHHRGHGHCIAKGMDVPRMVAELFGRRDGYCAGKGGSMHIADFDRGILGANGIVGAGLPIGAGAALAAQLRGTDEVFAVFFGDGATGQGVFHESLNYSQLARLPVVWVCENNRYAVETPLEAALAVDGPARLAAAYGMPTEVVDGFDVLAVREAAATAVRRARAGEGPAFLECVAYRYGVHAWRGVPIADPRPADLLAQAQARDPVAAFERRLLADGVLDADGLTALRDDVERELADAVAFAEASPRPDLADAYTGAYAV